MRNLKIIIGILLLMFILTSAGVVTYFYFNQDKIIQAFVKEINNHIDVEAKVESISLNIFEHWPLVAIELRNTSIRGANCGISKPLLQASNVSILANPISIVKGDYNIRHIFLREGSIYIFRDDQCSNYNILKKDSSAHNEIKLESIRLSKMHLDYVSRIEHQTFKFYSEKASISGRINEEEIYADHVGRWKITQLKSDNYELGSEEIIDLDHSLKLDRISDFLLISNLKANLFNSNIEADAILDLRADQSEITIQSQMFQIANLNAFLNRESLNQLKKYNVNGNFSFEAILRGNISKNRWKSILKLNSQALSFNIGESKQKISITELDAKWEVPQVSRWKNSILNLQSVKGKNGDSDFSGSIKIDQMVNSNIKVQLFTTQKAKFISEILNLPLEKDISGTIDIDLAYEGLVPSKESGFVRNAELSGILTLNDIKFQTLEPSVLIKNMNGQLVYEKGVLTIQSLKASTAQSKFSLDGIVRNSMDYFFTEKSKMLIETNIKSDFINLEEWINDSDDKNEYVLKLPERIIHRHELNIGSLNFKRFKAQNVKGDLILKNQTLNLDSIAMNVAGGNVFVNMNLDANDPKRIEWFTSGKLTNVFIDSVFYVFKDFNQDFIQQRHLEGQLTASFTGFMVSDDHLNFDLDKHIFSINSKISNGRLMFFEPLQAVSKFIKEDDLMNLKFDDLENEIFIKDRMITLPEMDISSNVRSINIQGTHSFDNVIDYRFEIPVTREKKDKDSRFGEIKDEKMGRVKLLLKLTGTTDDYRVKYDDEALKENIKTGIKDEVKELKKVLKNQKEEEDEIEIDEDEYFDFN